MVLVELLLKGLIPASLLQGIACSALGLASPSFCVPCNRLEEENF